MLICLERLPQLLELAFVLLEHGLVVLNLVLLWLVADLLRALCELQSGKCSMTDNDGVMAVKSQKKPSSGDNNMTV